MTHDYYYSNMALGKGINSDTGTETTLVNQVQGSALTYWE